MVGPDGLSSHECADPPANVRNIGKRQVLGDEIEIGSACAQELEIWRLVENAGTELWCSHLGAASVYILQVRKHEAILEPIQEHLSRLFVEGNELRRHVVVWVAHDL